MNPQQLKEIIEQLIDEVGKLNAVYAAKPNENGAHGNVAICIIDEDGSVYGKMWGTHQTERRGFFYNAWVKASQVWITGMKTGEFEKRLFNDEFPEEKFGIKKPDLIGWEGGQPVELKDGTRLAIGFSGYSGINDLAIVQAALAQVGFIGQP